MKKWIDGIPAPVLEKVKASGEQGNEWFENLDKLITDLENEWGFKVIKVLEGGTQAFIGEVDRGHQQKGILKVTMPQVIGETSFENEIKTLKYADGSGYAKIFHYDLQKGAALIQHLGQPLSVFHFSVEKQIEVICAALKKSWSQKIDNEKVQLQNGKDICSWFIDFINQLAAETKSSVSEDVINKIIRICHHRMEMYNPETSVLVHGDAHNGNILMDYTCNEFKLIDPDGIFCEPAYDLGLMLREWPDQLVEDPIRLGNERCRLLSRLTGVETRPIWEWGAIQAVATGMLYMSINEEDLGKEMLELGSVWTNYVFSEFY